MTVSKSYLQNGGYPPNWKEISRHVREVRAAFQCEWIDEDGVRCTRRHGEPIPGNAKGARTILTTAHRDHNPSNCDLDNLRAWCQKHHLAYDAKNHARNAKQTRAAKRARLYDELLFPYDETVAAYPVLPPPCEG